MLTCIKIQTRHCCEWVAVCHIASRLEVKGQTELTLTLIASIVSGCVEGHCQGLGHSVCGFCVRTNQVFCTH